MITTHFNIPTNSNDFDNLACSLLQRAWRAPNVQRNGRSGHGQNGVDFYGYDVENRMCGGQSKLHEPGKRLTKAEARDEVKKALSFNPKLDHYVIVTSSPRDPDLQEWARLQTEIHHPQGLFTVFIYFWDDLEELLQRNEDIATSYFGGLSSNKTQDSSPPKSQLPISETDHSKSLDPPQVFVGRQEELDELATVLIPSKQFDSVRVCALQGMPGVGKSYLADQFIYLHRLQFPGGAIRLPLEPEEPSSLEDLQRKLAHSLKLHPDISGDWATIRNQLQTHPGILHIENVDGHDSAKTAARLADALKGFPIIITGRFQGLGANAGWKLLRISPFDEQTALLQLESEFRSPLNPQESNEFKSLINALGYLPLAIHLAAGYLRLEQNPQEFLDLLRGQDFALEPSDPADPLYIRSPARSVLSRTFEISLKLLTKILGDNASEFLTGLHALGYASTTGFGKSLGETLSALPSNKFANLMLRARQLSILEAAIPEQRSDRAWRIHPLLAEFLRAKTNHKETITHLNKWFAARLVGSPRNDQGHWAEILQESDTLVAWLRMVDDEHREHIEQIGSDYAQINGPFSAWLDFYEQGLGAPLQQERRIHSLLTIHTIALRLGNYARALSAAEECVNLCKNQGRPQELADAKYAYAEVLNTTGSPRNALKLLTQEVLPAYESLRDTGGYLRALNLSCHLFEELGQLEQSLRLRIDRIIPILKETNQTQPLAITSTHTANLLSFLGRYDEAQQLLQTHTLPVIESSGMPREHAIALDAMARIIRARGNPDKALRIWRGQVIPIFEKLGNISDKAVMQIKAADTLAELGREREALDILQNEALPTFEKIGNKRERAVTLKIIAQILSDIDKADEAIKILVEDAIPCMEQVEAQRELAIARYDAARILFDRGNVGDWSQAELLLSQALQDAMAMKLPEAPLMLGLMQDLFHAGAKPSGTLQGRNSGNKRRFGRNERCPCGSGKKYKHCHGARGNST